MHIDLLKTDPAIRQTFEVMFFKCEYTGEFGATLQQIVCKTHQIEERLLEAYTAAAEKGLLRAGLKPASLARDTYAFLLGVVRLCVGSDENNPLSQSIPGMLGEHIALRRR
ncbi:MAG: hypothetical protein FWD62_12330 [Betaproteobacteria bacterium]|nr:hypothetical protein [Betaproteobacteria bacterium]